MPDSLEDLFLIQPPTAKRPLLGTMVLVVEDSRHACEGFRLMCQRSGARIRRAESLASAERHLRAYRPRIAIIDVGLPDGSGLDLIEQLARAEPRIDGIIAISGDDSQEDSALAAGADVFMPKPVKSVAAFQNTVLSLLPEDARPALAAQPLNDAVAPDPAALRDDLCLVVDLLRSDPGIETMRYAAGFLASLAKDTSHDELTRIAAALRAFVQDKGPMTSPHRLAEEITRHMPAVETV